MDHITSKEEKVLLENLRKQRERVFPGRSGIGRLAKAVGVSPGLLSQWLNGKQAPSPEQVYALAKALGVDARKARGRRKAEVDQGTYTAKVDARKALGRRKAKAGAPGNDLPEIVKGQIDAIDALIFILRYNKLALLDGETGKQYRGGIRILRQVVEQELRDKEAADRS